MTRGRVGESSLAADIGQMVSVIGQMEHGIGKTASIIGQIGELIAYLAQLSLGAGLNAARWRSFSV